MNCVNGMEVGLIVGVSIALNNIFIAVLNVWLEERAEERRWRKAMKEKYETR